MPIMLMMPMMMIVVVVVVVVVGRTLFPPVRLLHLLSCVGQVPRGPPMCDSFSARFHESVHDKGLGCGGSLVSSKCW